MIQSKVTLNHASGSIDINITGPTPETVAYISNRIKEIFGQAKKTQREQAVDDLMSKLNGVFGGGK